MWRWLGRVGVWLDSALWSKPLIDVHIFKCWTSSFVLSDIAFWSPIKTSKKSIEKTQLQKNSSYVTIQTFTFNRSLFKVCFIVNKVNGFLTCTSVWSFSEFTFSRLSAAVSQHTVYEILYIRYECWTRNHQTRGSQQLNVEITLTSTYSQPKNKKKWCIHIVFILSTYSINFCIQSNVSFIQ